MLKILQNYRDDLLNCRKRVEIRWNTAISIFVHHFPFKKWSIFLPELQSRPNSTKFDEWVLETYGIEVKEHDGAGYKAVRIEINWLYLRWTCFFGSHTCLPDLFRIFLPQPGIQSVYHALPLESGVCNVRFRIWSDAFLNYLLGWDCGFGPFLEVAAHFVPEKWNLSRIWHFSHLNAYFCRVQAKFQLRHLRKVKNAGLIWGQMHVFLGYINYQGWSPANFVICRRTWDGPWRNMLKIL